MSFVLAPLGFALVLAFVFYLMGYSAPNALPFVRRINDVISALPLWRTSQNGEEITFDAHGAKLRLVKLDTSKVWIGVPLPEPSGTDSPFRSTGGRPHHLHELPHLTLASARRVDAWGAHFGLNRQPKLGNAGLEAASWVETRASAAVVRDLFAPAEMHELAHAALRLGETELRLNDHGDALGLLIDDYGPHISAGDLDAALHALACARETLPRVDKAPVPRSRLHPLVQVGSMFVATMGALFAVISLGLVVESKTPVGASFYLLVGEVSFILVSLVALVGLVATRGKRFVRFGAIVITAIAVIPGLSALSLGAINMDLDASTQRVRANVESRRVVRGKGTSYLVMIRQTGLCPRKELVVSEAQYDDMAPTLEVTCGRGALSIPWVTRRDSR
ncbi:MAG: hypothetical protein U0271_21070 [Polyangiaceae bacterium]